MTTIDVYGGPLKRVIVAQAYSMCGQSFAEFELTPEEYDLALSFLNGIMMDLRDTWGVDLCYNFPYYGNGLSDEESGIPHGALRNVARMLAEDISPTIGKELTSRISLHDARGQLISTYGNVPTKPLTRNTPRGSGNRFPWLGQTFFNAHPEEKTKSFCECANPQCGDDPCKCRC